MPEKIEIDWEVFRNVQSVEWGSSLVSLLCKQDAVDEEWSGFVEWFRQFVPTQKDFEAKKKAIISICLRSLPEEEQEVICLTEDLLYSKARRGRVRTPQEDELMKRRTDILKKASRKKSVLFSKMNYPPEFSNVHVQAMRDQGLVQQAFNPNKDAHGFNIPLRMILCGAQGSGKVKECFYLHA